MKSVNLHITGTCTRTGTANTDCKLGNIDETLIEEYYGM